MCGCRGEADGAVLSTGGSDGGERLDGRDDSGEQAFGGREAEGFVGEIFGAGVVTVGGGEDRSGGARPARLRRGHCTRLVEDRTGGVEVVAPQRDGRRTEGS